MFKLLTYIVLFYILYRLVKPKWLNPAPTQEKISDNQKAKEAPKAGEYIDYEEIE